MGLMEQLRQSRFVTQLTQVQPMKGTVQKIWYPSSMVAHQPGVDEGVSINVTRNVLTGPVWGATNPGAFITIEGQPPTAPVVGQVAAALGSNAPIGGNC